MVDASVWVSYVLPEDLNHEASHAWLKKQLLKSKLLAPTIVLAEIGGAIARQTRDKALALAVINWLLQLPALQLEAVDRDLGNLAAHAAIALNLRGADAIYVALAQKLDVPLATWDEQQRERALAAIATIVPNGA